MAIVTAVPSMPISITIAPFLELGLMGVKSLLFILLCFLCDILLGELNVLQMFHDIWVQPTWNVENSLLKYELYVVR